MSKFKGKSPEIRFGNVKGLENSQIVAARLIYQKQDLEFLLPVQVWVDADGNYAPDGGEGCTLESISVAYHYSIDPRGISPEATNRCIAVMAQANELSREDKDGKKMPMKVDGVTGILQEKDSAENERLISCVVKNADGTTDWDYTDAEGNSVDMTEELLSNDYVLAEAVRGAFDSFINGGKSSAPADTKTEKENGSEGSTSKTPTPSSAESPEKSTASTSPNQTEETDTSPNGSSPSP